MAVRKRSGVEKIEEKWGTGIVEQVSLDLQNEFPNTKGFSTTNLWNMKKCFQFYSKESAKLQQLVGELDFPSVFAFVPWGHHIQIITKCKSTEEAIFYIRKVAAEGWSRSTLINYLDSDYYGKSGGAISNFDEQLPDIQGRLAQEITKIQIKYEQEIMGWKEFIKHWRNNQEFGEGKW